MKANFHFFYSLGLLALAALIVSLPARADDAGKCTHVSGTIAANLTSSNTAQGTVTGGLRGSVTASFTTTPEANGSISLSLNHIFVTESGDTLTTQDSGLLVPVPGAPGVYRMTVQYKITSGTGDLSGATGSLFNHGEAVLNSTPAQLTLRYSGDVCRAIHD
jgi:hypothetical protein